MGTNCWWDASLLARCCWSVPGKGIAPTTSGAVLQHSLPASFTLNLSLYAHTCVILFRYGVRHKASISGAVEFPLEGHELSIVNSKMLIQKLNSIHYCLCWLFMLSVYEFIYAVEPLITQFLYTGACLFAHAMPSMFSLSDFRWVTLKFFTSSNQFQYFSDSPCKYKMSFLFIKGYKETFLAQPNHTFQFSHFVSHLFMNVFRSWKGIFLILRYNSQLHFVRHEMF